MTQRINSFTEDFCTGTYSLKNSKLFFCHVDLLCFYKYFCYNFLSLYSSFAMNHYMALYNLFLHTHFVCYSTYILQLRFLSRRTYDCTLRFAVYCTSLIGRIGGDLAKSAFGNQFLSAVLGLYLLGVVRIVRVGRP